MRILYLLYRQTERILYGQNFKINRNSYYNLARSKSMDMTTDDLLALVSVLERDKWIYRTYWKFIKNDLNVVVTDLGPTESRGPT
jgi:hypothetical protein